MIRPILLIAILAVFLLILTVPVIWLSYKNQKPNSVNISQGQNPNKKFCHEYPVPCEGEDEDFCSQTCVDNLEYSCQDVSFPTFSGQKASVAKTQKFCLPEKRADEYKCEPKHGCVPTWTGWASTNRMEWDNLCMFPDYFGGNGCTTTPGVCTLNGVSFLEDQDYSEKGAPTPENCVLPEDLKKDYAVITREDGTPLIVLKSQCAFYLDAPPGDEGELPKQCHTHGCDPQGNCARGFGNLTLAECEKKGC